MAPEPHSAAYFNDQRDFWFNADWLALLAARLRLDEVHRAVDVGAGQGHWTLLLVPLLAPGAEIVGVERELEWVRLAAHEAHARGLADRVSFVTGVAEELPFADDSCDLVTCQTLLMHVRDARTVIAEMVRIVRPGGLVLLSEPNNVAPTLVRSNVERDEPLAQRVERLEFVLTLEAGKAALGEGDAEASDLLPGMLDEAGLVDVQAFTGDRTDLLVPPYAPPAQQALRAAILGGEETWMGRSREEAERLFVAGGGDGFDARWDRRLEEARRTTQALAEGRLHVAGGLMHYLICGRGPERR